jgi:spore coat protein A
MGRSNNGQRWFGPRHRSVILSAACSAGFVAVVTSPTRARADEVTLFASKDTTIYEEDGSLSNGAGAHFFSGLNARDMRRRALVAFDVERSVPAGATVTNVELHLILTRTQPGTTTITLHRLLAAWGEGSSRAPGNEGGGGPATEGDATWIYSDWPNMRWQTPGADFVATPSASLDVRDVGEYVWTSPELTSDVQMFLDQPTLNQGYILIGDDEPTAVSKRFESRESALDGPRLLVTFDPPPATGACCFADGSCGETLAPGSDCAGTYAGSGTTCDPGTCPEPVGACCTADALATCELVTASECASGTWRGGGTSCDPDPCPVILTPFVDPLPIPAVATPVAGSSGGKASYHIKQVQLEQRLHRDLPPTTVWGFDDGVVRGYPGPTIEARSGAPIEMTWQNDLRDASGRLLEKHALAVDHCLDGADSDAPRTVVHLHGGHVAQASDGYPEWTLLPGEQTQYEYPNEQRAATIWYHDHAMGITRLNVYMGLAGFYLIRDDEEEALKLPSGAYEIPLAIQDRSFNPDGSLRYPAAWQDGFYGENIVVNGKVSPYLEVDAGQYRLRLLNGSTSRTYTLSLSDGTYFYQIGNDGGLLPAAEPTYSVTISPGERADIVLDFRYTEHSVVLKNSAPAPFPSGGGVVPTDVLKFVVGDTPGYYHFIPTKLSRVSPLAETDAVRTRDLVIETTGDAMCGSNMWSINGKMWDEISEKPQLGTSEIWRFVNRSGITHPMHLHSLFFQVLDRQTFGVEGDEIVPRGEPQAPDPSETGWKDTVKVGPFEIVRVIAHFDDFAGRYPYHCHLIEHEDHGMMRQFETVAVCGDGALAHHYEECDDGNRRDGDGCDHSCRIETGVDGGAGAGAEAGASAEAGATGASKPGAANGGASGAPEATESPVAGAGGEVLELPPASSQATRESGSRGCAVARGTAIGDSDFTFTAALALLGRGVRSRARRAKSCKRL